MIPPPSDLSVGNPNSKLSRQRTGYYRKDSSGRVLLLVDKELARLPSRQASMVQVSSLGLALLNYPVTCHASSSGRPPIGLDVEGAL